MFGIALRRSCNVSYATWFSHPGTGLAGCRLVRVGGFVDGLGVLRTRSAESDEGQGFGRNRVDLVDRSSRISSDWNEPTILKIYSSCYVNLQVARLIENLKFTYIL